jgi:excinuclease UvrABC nuclease subunit
VERIDLQWSELASFTDTIINTLDTGIAGVYRLSARHSDNNIYVFYVGHDSDIKAMLLRHLNSTDGNPCIATQIKNVCYFKYAKVEGSIERDLAFKQLCKVYHPTCNSVQQFVTEDVAIINL